MFTALDSKSPKGLLQTAAPRGGQSKRMADNDHIHSTLGISQLLFLGRGLNFNVTTDQVIPRVGGNTFTKFLIQTIRIFDASASLTTAQGGIYTDDTKGGVALMATTHAFTTLTGATLGMDATLAAAARDELTANELWLSLTTAQGSAATASVAVFGIPTV